MKKTLASMAALAVLVTSVPAVFAQGFSPTMQKSSIVVNGQHFSTQYKFVYDGTTYMPIWYVMQVLEKIKGFSVTWNGTTHQWNIDGPFGMPNLNLNSKSGQTSILMNGKVVESNIDTLVSTDPASGQATTFMPIWYIQQALNAGGFNSNTDAWNGVNGNWSLNFSESSTSSTSTTSSAPTPAEITSTVQEYLKESNYGANNVSGYSPLATATQWYPNPSDIFNNKKFSTSDFVDNKVLQNSPYVIMNNEGSGVWFVLQYVGKSSSGDTSYWMGEQVDQSTGMVTDINTSLMPFQKSTFPNLAVPKTGGYTFSSAPVNSGWAIGGNLFVIDPPGYDPNSNN